MKTLNFESITQLIEGTLSNKFTWQSINQLSFNNRKIVNLKFKDHESTTHVLTNKSYFLQIDNKTYILIEMSILNNYPDYIMVCEFDIENIVSESKDKPHAKPIQFQINSVDEPLLYKLAIIVKNQVPSTSISNPKD